jgi:hypothetical protein
MHKLLTSAILIGAFGLTTPALADGGIKIGTLSCRQEGGWGLILGSSRDVRCTFVHGDRVEHYQGSITKMGVDIGYQRSGTMVWSVIAPHLDEAHGALAGHYGGVTADATVGVGIGANALVGGFDRSLALQPVSVQGTTGLDVAAGVGGMTLRPERRG